MSGKSSRVSGIWQLVGSKQMPDWISLDFKLETEGRQIICSGATDEPLAKSIWLSVPWNSVASLRCDNIVAMEEPYSCMPQCHRVCHLLSDVGRSGPGKQTCHSVSCCKFLDVNGRCSLCSSAICVSKGKKWGEQTDLTESGTSWRGDTVNDPDQGSPM